MNTDTTTNIFITHDQINNINGISGRITHTNILESIPDNCLSTRLDKIPNNYTEWRWRILEFTDGKQVLEISYYKSMFKNRIYFNKYGDWVEREISKEYDEYVIKEYYYYTS